MVSLAQRACDERENCPEKELQTGQARLKADARVETGGPAVPARLELLALAPPEPEAPVRE
jgi:hypothetical protein